jgi:hypothetical protein
MKHGFSQLNRHPGEGRGDASYQKSLNALSLAGVKSLAPAATGVMVTGEQKCTH